MLPPALLQGLRAAAGTHLEPDALLTAVPRFTMVTPVGQSLSLLIRSCIFPVAIGAELICLAKDCY